MVPVPARSLSLPEPRYVHCAISSPGFSRLIHRIQITFEWLQHDQRTGEDPISGGHKGPVQVYIAKAPSNANSFDGQGTVWTKIYSSGLINAQSQQWATDVVNANSGKHSVTIPASLPAGQYLLRAEIVSSLTLSLMHIVLTNIVQIALHVAQSYPGAQFVSSLATNIYCSSSHRCFIVHRLCSGQHQRWW